MWKGLENIIERVTSEKAINVLQNSRHYLFVIGAPIFMYGIFSEYSNPLRTPSLYFSLVLGLEIGALYVIEKTVTGIRDYILGRKKRYIKVKIVV